jgi:hypothetical protein
MRLTHDKTRVRAQELILNPIQRKRNMTTAVKIPMQSSAMVDDKTFFVGTIERHYELQ